MTKASTTNSKLPVHDTAAQEQVMSQVLEKGQETYQLPPLRAERPPGFLDDFFDWLQSLFPEFSTGPLDLQSLFYFLGFAVLIALIGYLLFLIYKRVQSNSPRRMTLSAPEQRKGKSPEEQMIAELSRALQGQKYDLAARLRWKLFLVQASLPVFWTPLEFSRKNPGEGSSPLQRFASDLPHHYRTMYGPGQPTEQAYNHLVNDLKDLMERE